MNRGRLKITRTNEDDKCSMRNSTIKINLYCITIRKAAKGIKNLVIEFDGHGLANNYDRQIQGETNFRSIFVQLKQK